MKKQIIIDYEEYLKLEECYKIVHNKFRNTSYNYPPDDEVNTQYIKDEELFNLLDEKRFGDTYNNTLQKIVIRR